LRRAAEMTRTSIRPRAKPADAAAAADSVESRSPEPANDCPLCPRLQAFRHENRKKQPDWFNAPVPAFGDITAEVLIVGLAPGLQGANRTGRPFTGDYAGDLLYATLLDVGFAEGEYEERPDDSLTLRNCRIANAVHCVPPQNKPLPAEINTCRQFLIARIHEMPRLRAIVALGRIAHDSTVKALGLSASGAPFAHGAAHEAGKFTLYDSYHCSRYNTNTGVLTPDMFRSVFMQVRSDLG